MNSTGIKNGLIRICLATILLLLISGSVWGDVILVPPFKFLNQKSFDGHFQVRAEEAFTWLGAEAKAKNPEVQILDPNHSTREINKDRGKADIYVRGYITRANVFRISHGDLGESLFCDVTAVIEYFNIITGEIYKSQELTYETSLKTKPSYEAEHLPGEFERAAQKAVKLLCGRVFENANVTQLTASVLERDGSEIWIDKGESSGVTQGSIFYYPSPSDIKASIKIEDSQEKIARGKVLFEQPDDKLDKGKAVVKTFIDSNAKGKWKVQISDFYLGSGNDLISQTSLDPVTARQWLLDELAARKEFVMLPSIDQSGIMEEQHAAESSGDARYLSITDNRVFPDAFARGVLMQASMIETTAEKGGQTYRLYKIALRLGLEIVDRKTGAVLFFASKNFENNQLDSEGVQENDPASLIRSLMKSGIAELVSGPGDKFAKERKSSRVIVDKVNDDSFTTKGEALVFPGMIMELYREGKELRGFDGQPLGSVRNKIGKAKIIKVDDNRATAKVLFTTKGIKVEKGDYAVLASDAARPVKGIYQAGAMTIVSESDLSVADKAAFPEILAGAVEEKQDWQAMAPPSRFESLQDERSKLKKGDFEATSDLDNYIGSELLSPTVVVSGKVIVSPPEKISDTQKTLKMKIELTFSDADTATTILEKELSLSRKLSAGSGVTLGMEKNNLKFQYFEMSRLLLDELMKRSVKELQSTK